MTEKRKTIMESFFIDEISGVDQPAQEGAEVLLIKRNEEGMEKGAYYFDFADPYMTSEVDGHVHLLDKAGGRAGETTYSKSEGEDCGHTHPWILGSEGKVIIGVVKEKAEDVLKVLKGTKEGKYAQIIGEAKKDIKGVAMETIVGGLRIVDPPASDPVPRIC